MGHTTDCTSHKGYACNCGFELARRPPTWQEMAARAPMTDCTEAAFYLVWRVCGASPTKIHTSFESAKAEATRLAKLHLDAKFVVMRTEWSIAVRPNPVTVTTTFAG
jgi:hypothetical protein